MATVNDEFRVGDLIARVGGTCKWVVVDVSDSHYKLHKRLEGLLIPKELAHNEYVKVGRRQLKRKTFVETGMMTLVRHEVVGDAGET